MSDGLRMYVMTAAYGQYTIYGGGKEIRSGVPIGWAFMCGFADVGDSDDL